MMKTQWIIIFQKDFPYVYRAEKINIIVYPYIYPYSIVVFCGWLYFTSYWTFFIVCLVTMGKAPWYAQWLLHYTFVHWYKMAHSYDLVGRSTKSTIIYYTCILPRKSLPGPRNVVCRAFLMSRGKGLRFSLCIHPHHLRHSCQASRKLSPLLYYSINHCSSSRRGHNDIDAP